MKKASIKLTVNCLPCKQKMWVRFLLGAPLSGYTLILLVVLSGCSANWHLKKAIQKGAMVQVDTVYKTVEVMFPEIMYDTIVRIENWNDTITIVKDSLITKIKVNIQEKTVYVKNNLKPMTKIVRVPVTVTRNIKVASKFYRDLFFGLLSINLLLLFIAWLVTKRKQP